MARKWLSKRVRFEIFKRDGFRCIYCGATPMQAALVADHVVPVAAGGASDPANLVTACVDCNGGKAAVPLETRKFEPVKSAKAIRDHAKQIAEYLTLQKEIVEARAAVVQELACYWESVIGRMTTDMFGRLAGLLAEWPYQKLISAIDITGGRLGCPGTEFDSRTAVGQTKYFHGILRRWREEKPQ